jgi:hypothetical protein
VGDRQDTAAGLFLVPGHVIPEALRILAVERPERDNLLHPVGSVPKDHNPVKVVAAHCRAVFVAVKSGEGPRLIVF